MSWQYVLISIADLYAIILVIYCCLTWIPPTRPGSVFSMIREFFARISEPFLGLFRKFIPPIGGMMDISPIVAILVLQFGVRFIVSLF